MKPNNVCKHLRTKKMFIPAEADEVFPAAGAEAERAAGHCWCNRTLSEVGADDRQVSIDISNPSRTCFEE